MKSYEKGQDGEPLTIEEDMYNFCLHNVGGVNSGWHHEIDDSGVSTYYYINVEGVVSDTLEIRRYNNIVQAEIPNLYGIGINLDLNNGLLKLLGRDSVVLSEEALPLGATMSSIEHNDELGTVTFKFTNLDDIVLDLKEIISLSNYYTKQEIDEMFKVKTSVIEDTSVEFTILNNSDTSFTSLESAVFTIPSDVEHGYSAAISIRLNTNYPQIQFDNQSEFDTKFILNNAFVPSTAIPWAMENQFELLFLCDGIDLKVYVQVLEG